MYVVETGTLACTKVFAGNTEPTALKEFQPGEGFGELALLYNAPRAATITAKTDCILWSLDRETFNHIVKDAAARKRERYE
jgi:cAMP-dependent protein kinase regulator